MTGSITSFVAVYSGVVIRSIRQLEAPDPSQSLLRGVLARSQELWN